MNTDYLKEFVVLAETKKLLGSFRPVIHEPVDIIQTH